ncbi:MAG: hypothetical protein GY838_13700 [bacterium]|nr:hypothetical protein [bacterium]
MNKKTKPGVESSPDRAKFHAMESFPWFAFGTHIVISRVEGEERTTAGGVVIPESADSEKLTTGIIVAIGPGAWLPYGGFVDPAKDYKLKVGYVVFCEVNVGVPIRVDNRDYWVIQPDDILMVLRQGQGIPLRARLQGRLVEAVAAHKSLGENAGEGVSEDNRPPLVDRSALHKAPEEIREMRQTEEGKSTKTQVLVDGLKK